MVPLQVPLSGKRKVHSRRMTFITLVESGHIRTIHCWSSSISVNRIDLAS